MSEEPDMPKDHRQRLGRQGEDMAVHHLEEQGYRILTRGFRCPQGEIDVIAREGEVLAFVEVRLKTSPEYGDPLESLTPTKLAHIRRTALWYLHQEDLEDAYCRFDVVAVTLEDGSWQVDLLRDAFE